MWTSIFLFDKPGAGHYPQSDTSFHRRLFFIRTWIIKLIMGQYNTRADNLNPVTANSFLNNAK